jgi:hypothetical protein
MSGLDNRGKDKPAAGERLDLTSLPGGGVQHPARGEAKRFVGVHFACCRVYTRIYINRDESAYVGNCPRCGKRVRLGIAPDGVDSRFFTAY